MDYNEDKIDDYTLALLYLVSHERNEGMGARAWKGFVTSEYYQLRLRNIGYSAMLIIREE